MEIEPLGDKWRSFGWNVLTCNGNDHSEIIEAYDQASRSREKPSVIIASTRMGFGLPSIEDDYRWHGKAPSRKQRNEFLKELEENHK
jgi:transketolase